MRGEGEGARQIGIAGRSHDGAEPAALGRGQKGAVGAVAVSDQGDPIPIDPTPVRRQIDDLADPLCKVVKPGTGCAVAGQAGNEHGVSRRGEDGGVDVTTLSGRPEPGRRDRIGRARVHHHRHRRRGPGRCVREQKPAGQGLAVRTGVRQGFDAAPVQSIERGVERGQNLNPVGPMQP